jgi:hypothetical protein
VADGSVIDLPVWPILRVLSLRAFR